ncbi:WS/DGAT domain-containing protein [Micromonospora globbae]|uniref:WS/DGAT domain-containing protein n=1 Tax=Micromonospora globbae TaxID=1894969 RepID=A0ABZ1SB85_9ACTN|nr:wax ester/triacylglycerol synthase domain-containing protein [Micromonospora globbae]
MNTPAGPEPAEPVARRVLVVSADIGGGHDATGRALEERVHAIWPGSRVGWVDTLEVMGPGVGRGFRRTYVTNVAVTPWLYEFFWASLWRHRWFAATAKWFTGSWAGRRLGPVIEGFDPDLIVSTYPLGSAGLAWLRRHRGLGVPVGAWISDFAPHPFWVYPELDLNVVVHPAALPVAAVAAEGSSLGVCAPPVLDSFRPGDRVAAARRCDLDPDRAAVVVACGSYGFGAVEEAIRALVGIGDPIQVVAVCGRNDRLAARLAALDVPPGRLLVRGWVDDMPTLLQAARLLVTNAGGATALEALATGTPIVMYRPIAAHGTANAALMAAAGLAETAHTPQALVAGVRSRLALPARTVEVPPDGRLPDLGLPAVAAARTSRVGAPGDAAARGDAAGDAAAGDDASARGDARTRGRAGGAPRRRPASWPLRAQDAFFLHVQTPTEPQQIGTVMELGARPDGQPVTRAEVTALLARRLPAITTLRRRLVDRGRWRRPGWVIDRYVDPAAHVDEIHVAPGDDGGAAVDRFWSEPLPTDRPPWRMLLVGGLPDGRTRLAVKLHHCLGDGLSVIAVLRRLLDAPEPPRREAPAGGRTLLGRRGAPAPERGGLDQARETARQLGRTVRGLARLATQGTAPRTPLNRRLDSSRRRLLTASLPAADVLRAARSCQAHPSELMLALTAAALGAAHPAPVPERLRVMFAVSRDARRRAPTQGNWTGAVTLDLPMGAGPPRDRVAAVRRSLRDALRSGEPEAANLVMRAMGVLPAPLHAAMARRVYTSRRLNVIVSYVPATFPPRVLSGAPLRAAAPVVGLADGVHIGIGILRLGGSFGLGVLLTGALADVGDTVVAQVRANLAALLAEIDAHPEGGPQPEAGSTPATAGSTPATAGSAGAVRAAAGAGSRARGPRDGGGPDGADRAADGPATDDAAVPGAPPPGVPRCA